MKSTCQGTVSTILPAALRAALAPLLALTDNYAVLCQLLWRLLL